MQPIRVVLAEPPAELRAEIRAALAGQPDMLVVGEPRGEVEVLLHAAEADVVILGMAGAAMPAVAERLLDEYPRIAVIAVDGEAAQGRLYRLRPHVTRLDQVTPAELVAAIRRAAADLPV